MPSTKRTGCYPTIAINADDVLASWAPFVVGAHDAITLATDWIDFDAENQATIMQALIRDHDRSIPLVWLTVDRRTLEDYRTPYEPSLFMTPD